MSHLVGMSFQQRSRGIRDLVLSPRMSGAWRSGVGAVVLALMVVACSSGSETSVGESPEETVTFATDGQDGAPSDSIEIRPEDSALVDVLSAGLGVEAGFIALVDALGRGYDITTILSAVADDTLQTDGQIIVSGALVAPTRPASVLLIVENADAPSADAEGLRHGLVQRPAGLDEDFDGVNGRGLFTLLRDARIGDPSSSDVDSGIQVTRLIVVLARSGYSMDQIIQALVFDENVWEVRSGCTALADGVDLITPGYPDAGGCAETVAHVAASQDDDIDALDIGAPIAAGELDPDRPRGVYQATLEDISAQLGADSSSIVSNLVSVDLDGDVPELALLWVAQLTGSYDLSPDVICVIEARMEIERAPLVGATFVDGQWSGEASISVGSFDGTCAPGSQDNESEIGSIIVTFTATDTTLSGAFSGEGDTLSFTGSAVS